MKFLRFRYLNEKGQTAIEYLLLLVVSVTIGVTFKKKMEEFVLDNPNSILTQQMNGLSAAFNQDTSGRFQRYGLAR